MTLVVLLTLLLALGSCVQGATYNLGPSDSWQTRISSGLVAGDIVNLSPGTYNVNRRWGVTLQGAANNPIVIQGTGSQPVIFSRGDIIENVIDISDSYNFRISNVQFTVASGSTIKGVRLGTKSVHDAIFDGITINQPTASGFTANDGGVEYWNITLKNSVIQNTADTGECVYLGCQSNNCRIRDSLIDRNYCYNTLAVTDANVGSGFQIKSGSYNVVVSNNVCYKTRGVCILMYDSFNQKENIIEGNLIVEANNHGIQVTAGAIIRNNIVISATISGIAVIRNDPMPGSEIRNVKIYHNTVTGAGEGCIRLNRQESSLIVANNALFCGDKNVVSGTGITGSQFFNNYGVGVSTPSSGFTAVSSITAELINPASRNFYPKAGSTLIGNGNALYVPPLDFNTLPRSGAATVGAYHYSGTSNPGPIPAFGLKQFPAGATTTTTTATATTTSKTTTDTATTTSKTTTATATTTSKTTTDTTTGTATTESSSSSSPSPSSSTTDNDQGSSASIIIVGALLMFGSMIITLMF